MLLSGSTAIPAKWETKFTKVFRRGYRQKDQPNKDRVKRFLDEMASSDDPRTFGTLKDTQYGRVFVVEFGKYRMAYRVDFSSRIIEFDRVCDHKAVYGKDN